MNRLFSVIFALLIISNAFSQGDGIARLRQEVEYKAEISGVMSAGSSGYAPFWFTANRYGLSSAEKNSGYIRASIIRNSEADSLRRWRVGYGLDFVGAIYHANYFNVQQAFLDFQFLKTRLSLGAKQRTMELKNDSLSMGGMTFSDNAWPIPQVRLELQDWWNISKKARLVFIKGHVAYGIHTDGKWQASNNKENIMSPYAKKVLYHSKAGYMRIGNPERFPLSFTGGLEMVCQFGGKIWNLQQRGGVDGTFDNPVNVSHGIKDYFNALIPGGSDANDGNYANVAGNQLGSWNFSIDWYAKNWMLRAYMDHFFEDHSQMFLQYGWKDMLVGIETHLPQNRIVSNIVYEWMSTMDQSSGIYHDQTTVLPIQISGNDCYYNHHLYGGYQHWGQMQGNPLLLSPIYNTDGSLSPHFNRVTVHHVGLSGRPYNDIRWRALYTHSYTLGTYANPLSHPKHMDALLLEANYVPHQLKGWKFSFAYGANFGSLLKTSNGAQLTITKFGVFH